MFLVSTFLHDPPDLARATPVDWLGIVLLTVGVGIACNTCSRKGNAKDWFADAADPPPGDPFGRLPRRDDLVGAQPRNTHPVVDFRVLQNRTLAASIFLFIALGFGLYGGVSSFRCSPRGSCTSRRPKPVSRCCPAASPPVERADLRTPAQREEAARRSALLIFFGVLLFVVSMWKMGHLTTVAGEVDVRNALLVRGFGLGLLFTPINNVAYASIEPHEAQQAAGLINLRASLAARSGSPCCSTTCRSTSSITAPTW